MASDRSSTTSPASTTYEHAKTRAAQVRRQPLPEGASATGSAKARDLAAVQVPQVDWSAYTDDQHMPVDLDCALRKLILCGMSTTDAVRVLGELATDCEKPEDPRYFKVDDDTATLQVPLFVGQATARECADAARYLSDHGLRLLQIVAWDLRSGKGTIADDGEDAACAIHCARAVLSLAHNMAEAGLRAPSATEGVRHGS